MLNDAQQPTDYRSLLIRYMAKVIDRESITLAESFSYNIDLSDTDLAVLALLEIEARAEVDKASRR
jgi:hypothetical protein